MTTDHSGTVPAPQSHIVVGYSATSTGQDALHLGIAMARERNAHLHLVSVSVENTYFSAGQPFDHSYERILDRQLQEWLDEAAAQVPDDVPVSTHVAAGESAPEGLLDATRELNAGLLVIGARSGGLLHRHRIGTMATHLLHSSHVPVALAPAGYRFTGPIGRVTAMFGRRRGATDLIGEAIITAQQRNIPLRLVSLLMVDRNALEDSLSHAADRDKVLHELEVYGNSRLAEDATELLESGRASTVIASGRDVAEAMAGLTWEKDEIVLVASSRVAPRGRLFLGVMAARMLQVASVPVVVIPVGFSRGTTAAED